MKATMKRVLSMVLVIALTATIAIGGTVAYLTQNDVGDEKNVFSVGDIDISLKEEVGIYGEGGEVKDTDEGAEYIEVMPGDYLKKEVTVYNNGKTPAYVAVTVTLNNFKQIQSVIDGYGDDDDVAEAMLDNVFDGWGLTVNDRYVDGVKDMSYKNSNKELPEYVLHVDSSKTTAAGDVGHHSIENWFQSENEKAGFSGYKYQHQYVGKGYYTADMGNYELCYTYYLLLPAGESSTLFNGLNVPAEFDNEQVKMFDGLEINVDAKAIQADNMGVAEQYKDDPDGKAKTAFAILAGDINVPEYSNKPSGTITYGFTTTDRIWGETTNNAKNSVVIKVYSDDTYMGESSLNNIDGIIDGDVYVSWSIKLDAPANSDGYWSMKWEKAPSVDLQPTTVELWIDGEKVAENIVKLCAPDDLHPIVGYVINAEGTILRYVIDPTDVKVGAGETYVPFNPSTVTVNGNTVNDLLSAINNAKAGDTVKLTSDIDLGSTQLAIEKNIILDLDGNTIKADRGYGIISLKSGSSLKNGTLDVKTNVAAIRAFNAGTIENVTINIVPKETGKVVTGIAVQGGYHVGTISNVTITGATQGIEVYKGSAVDLIENVNVEASSNGVHKDGYNVNGTALQINAGNVGKVVNSTLNGEVYGVHMMLNGEYNVALTLENCDVIGETAGIYAHDEVGIANSTNCSLTLNYDDETEITGGVITEFEAEALPYVQINGVKGTAASVSTVEELDAAIAAGKTELNLAAGTYTIPASAKGKTLTITGSGTENTTIEIVPAGQGEANGQLDYSLDGSTVTFNNLTIKTNGNLYAGYARMSGTYNNCVIQNTYSLGLNTVNVFNNCEINISAEYLRINGAKSAEFNSCTFNTDGRAILVFQDGTNLEQSVTVKDCTFNATAAAYTWDNIHVAAVSIDSTQGLSYEVVFEGNNTVDEDFAGLCQIKNEKASITITGATPTEITKKQ